MIKEIEAKDGSSVLVLEAYGKELPLSSKYQPTKEAERILAGHLDSPIEVAVLFGAGHLALIQKMYLELPTDKIFILDTDKAVIQKSKDIFFSDKQDAKSPEVTFALGEEEENYIQDYFSKAVKPRVKFFFNRNQVQRNPEGFESIKQKISGYHDKKNINVATISRFEKLWLRNITNNTETIIHSPGVNEFKHHFQGAKAVIVGAGPSLTKNIATLKVCQEDITIIAVDTVYKTLLQHGITPTIVVVVDPQKINSKYIENISQTDIEKSIFVAEPAVTPNALRDKKKASLTLRHNFSLLQISLQLFWF